MAQLQSCKYFPIYEEAVCHIWICNCSILNFLWGKFNLLFISVPISSLRERWKDWWETSSGCEDHERTSGWRVVWSPLQIHSGLSGGGGGGGGQALTWIIPNHGTHTEQQREGVVTHFIKTLKYSFYWIFVFFFSTLVYYLYRVDTSSAVWDILYLVV